MCSRWGFNLHKFTSNSRKVLEMIPEANQAEEDTELTECALGVQWSIEADAFKFTLEARPCTRRGILSTVSSIFDPLGLVAPVLLEKNQFFKNPLLQPKDFGPVEKCELHHFSDTSFRGYSLCTYLRMTDAQGRINCSCLLGKSRVTPLKAITVPRLELTAAVV